MNQIPWMQEIEIRYVNTWHYKTTMHILRYILQQRSSWSTLRIRPSWSRSRLKLSPIALWACTLLPCPAQYLAVYCNGSSFTPSTFYYLGGFSLMYKETSQQHYTTHGTYVYTSHQHYYSFILSAHLPFFLAGWLSATRHAGYRHVALVSKISKSIFFLPSREANF
jgi:hypothetical protein